MSIALHAVRTVIARWQTGTSLSRPRHPSL